MTEGLIKAETTIHTSGVNVALSIRCGGPDSIGKVVLTNHERRLSQATLQADLETVTGS